MLRNLAYKGGEATVHTQFEKVKANQIFNIKCIMQLVNSGWLNMFKYIPKNWLKSSFLESLAVLDSLLYPTENEWVQELKVKHIHDTRCQD